MEEPRFQGGLGMPPKTPHRSRRQENEKIRHTISQGESQPHNQHRHNKHPVDDPLKIATTFSSLSDGTAGNNWNANVNPPGTTTQKTNVKKKGPLKMGNFLAEARKRTVHSHGYSHASNGYRTPGRSVQSGTTSSTGHISRGEFFEMAADKFVSEAGSISLSPRRVKLVHSPAPNFSTLEESTSQSDVDTRGEEKKQDQTPPADKDKAVFSFPKQTMEPVATRVYPVQVLQAQTAAPEQAPRSSWLDSMEPNQQHPPPNKDLGVMNIVRSESDSTDVYLDDEEEEAKRNYPAALPPPLPIPVEQPLPPIQPQKQPPPPLAPKLVLAPPAAMEPPPCEPPTTTTADDSTKSFVGLKALPVDRYRPPTATAQASSQMQFYRDKLVAFFADDDGSHEETSALMKELEDLTDSEDPPGTRGGGRTAAVNHSSDDDSSNPDAVEASQSSALSQSQSSRQEAYMQMEQEAAQKKAPPPAAAIAFQTTASSDDDSYNPDAVMSDLEHSSNHLDASQNQSFQSNTRQDRYTRLEQEAQKAAPVAAMYTQRAESSDDDSYNPDAVVSDLEDSNNLDASHSASQQDRYTRLEQEAKKAAVYTATASSDDDSYDPEAMEAGFSTPQKTKVDTSHHKATYNDESDDSYNANVAPYPPATTPTSVPFVDTEEAIHNRPTPLADDSHRSMLEETKEENADRRVRVCRWFLVALLLFGLACVGVGMYLYFGTTSYGYSPAPTVAPTTAAPVIPYSSSPNTKATPAPSLVNAATPAPSTTVTMSKPTQASPVVPQTPSTSKPTQAILTSPAPTVTETEALATQTPTQFPTSASSAPSPPLTATETNAPTVTATINFATANPTAGMATEAPTIALTTIIEPTTLAPTNTYWSIIEPTTLAPTNTYWSIIEPTTLAPTTSVPTTPKPTPLELSDEFVVTATPAPVTPVPTTPPPVTTSLPTRDDFVVLATPAPSSAPPPPTVDDTDILESLPEETWETIRQNPGSAQARSLRWMIADPFIANYPQWRQEQRFALATMYYSWFDLSAMSILSVALAQEGEARGRPGGPNNGNDGRGAGRGGRENNGGERGRGQGRRLLRGSQRFLQTLTPGNWLDYESPECNWYYTANNETDESWSLASVAVTSASQRDVTAPACNIDRVYERLNVPRSEQSQPGRVADIYMASLPPEIAMLTDLTLLHMPNNKVPVTLESFLPETLASMRLRQIDFSQSSIQEWNAPSVLRLPKTLEVLDLSYNQMKGELFTEIGLLLNSLRELYLDGNSLKGSIPISIPSWTRLRNFHASSNDLTGNLPSEIGWLSSHLEVLSLSANRLNGAVPSEVGSLSLLSSLDLDANNFEGFIPSQVGQMSSLIYFGLADNNLEGSIPTELGLLSRLDSVRLSNNRLDGPIPSEVGLLSALTNFQMHANGLIGSLPKELGALSNTLYSLDLHDNGLTGTIFTEIGNLRATNFLYLYENSFSGTIPTEIGLLKKASYIGLENNLLTGRIPSQFGAMKELRYLHLSDNDLTSTIPAELGNLPLLKYLFLANNDLEGEIPSELGMLSELRYLDLGGGNDGLKGSVPAELCALPELTIRIRCNKVKCDCGCQCA